MVAEQNNEFSGITNPTIRALLNKLVGNDYKLRREALKEILRMNVEIETASLARCLEVAQRTEQIRKRLKGYSSMGSSGDCFDDWEEKFNGEIKSLKSELEKEKRNSLRLAAGTAEQEASRILSADSRIAKLPIGYYNQVNRTFNYTPAALNLLGVDDTQVNGRMGWKGLLRLVRKDDRRGLYEAIRSGEPIFHYKAQTSKSHPKTLYLTTQPVEFGDRGKVGFVISLYDRVKESKVEDRLNEGAERVVKTLEEMSSSLTSGPQNSN